MFNVSQGMFWILGIQPSDRASKSLPSLSLQSSGGWGEEIDNTHKYVVCHGGNALEENEVG